MLHVVKMVQVAPYRWNVVSPKGHIMVEDLSLSPHKAEEWIKSYISSFMGWSYVIIPLIRSLK